MTAELDWNSLFTVPGLNSECRNTESDIAEEKSSPFYKNLLQIRKEA